MSLVHLGSSRTLSSTSGLPAGNAATTLSPVKSPVAFGSWNNCVKANAWKLSIPMTPTFTGAAGSSALPVRGFDKASKTVNVNNGPPDTYFASKYLKWAFGQTNWPAIPIPNWINESLTSKAFYNETHWKRPSFDKLVLQAQAQQDPAKAKELWHEVQKVLYDQGGYLIWGFAPFLDGVSKKVQGVVPSGFFALGNFDFQHFWLA